MPALAPETYNARGTYRDGEADMKTSQSFIAQCHPAQQQSQKIDVAAEERKGNEGPPGLPGVAGWSTCSASRAGVQTVQ